MQLVSVFFDRIAAALRFRCNSHWMKMREIEARRSLHSRDTSHEKPNSLLELHAPCNSRPKTHTHFGISQHRHRTSKKALEWHSGMMCVREREIDSISAEKFALQKKGNSSNRLAFESYSQLKRLNWLFTLSQKCLNRFEGHGKGTHIEWSLDYWIIYSMNFVFSAIPLHARRWKNYNLFFLQFYDWIIVEVVKAIEEKEIIIIKKWKWNVLQLKKNKIKCVWNRFVTQIAFN